MSNPCRTTWPFVQGQEMPHLLPPSEQSEVRSAAPVPPGHVRLRVIPNLRSKSCTSRSPTCLNLPKRRNSSDRYEKSAWQKNLLINYLQPSTKCSIFLCPVWKAGFAVTLCWLCDTIQQETLAFTLSWWNYQGLLTVILCMAIALFFISNLSMLFCVYLTTKLFY